MKLALSIFLIVPIILIPACKNSEKSTQASSNTNISTAQNDKMTNNQVIESKLDVKSNDSITQTTEKSQTENYSMVVSFYSIGSGIDRPVAQEFDYLVKDFQEQFGEDFIAERVSWGREGEIDYCIQLEKLKLVAKDSFKNRANVILKKTERVHSKENAPCIRRRHQ
jgi:hypothetical protein